MATLYLRPSKLTFYNSVYICFIKNQSTNTEMQSQRNQNLD